MLTSAQATGSRAEAGTGTSCPSEAEESAAEERRKVYTDPRPPYGRIGLTMRRDDPVEP